MTHNQIIGYLMSGKIFYSENYGYLLEKQTLNDDFLLAGYFNPAVITFLNSKNLTYKPATRLSSTLLLANNTFSPAPAELRQVCI
jgi:hypothetical protein